MAKNILLILFFFVFIISRGYSQLAVSIQTSANPVCQGQSTTLTANPTGGVGPYLYHWNTLPVGTEIGTANGIPVAPASTTTYTVTVTDGNNSTATSSIIITVNPNPNANFSFPPANSCANTPLSFTNSSTGNGLTYSWNFGDPASGAGNLSSLANPTHTFNATTGNGTQTFSVTLTATNSSGCSSSIAHSITVMQIPDASIQDFTSSKPFTNCGGTTFNLVVDNISTTAATNTQYTINWGDMTAPYSSASLPATGTNHLYAAQGYFSIALIVTGQNGCISSKMYSVFNGSNPAVGLENPGSTVDLCAPVSLTFPITGTTNNPPGTTYTITTNTGSPPVVFNHPPPLSYSHAFTTSSCNAVGANTPNSFIITIRAENQCKFSISTIEPITTSIAPKADFTATDSTAACINKLIIFTNTSKVGIQIDNSYNCDYTTMNNWVISPATGWSVASGTLGNPVPTNNPNTWGSKSLGVSFATPGSYNITTAVTNSCGNSMLTKTVCIQSPLTPTPPSFAINPAAGCKPLNVSVTNTTIPVTGCVPATFKWSVLYGAGYCGTSPSWSYTSGTDATSLNPSFVFNESGTYTISLVVTNSCGTLTTAHTVLVKQPPTASMNPIPNNCGASTVTPTATTTNCGDVALSYSWSFGQGSPASSTSSNPGPVLFSAVGLHTISLSLTNECGTATTETSFTIYPLPAVTAGSDISICTGQSTILSGNASNGATPYLYSWSSNPSGFISGIQNPSVSPLVNTTYSLGVNDANSCFGTANVTVTVNAKPVIPDQTTSICSEGTFALTPGNVPPLVIVPPGTTYSWPAPIVTGGITGGAGGINQTPITGTLTNTTNSAQTATYTITPTSGSTGNCLGSSFKVIVSVSPAGQVDQPENMVACDGATTAPITFSTNNAGGTAAYSWTNNTPSIGLGASGTGSISSFTAVNTGTSPIVATITVTPQYSTGGPTCPGSQKTFTITIHRSLSVQFSMPDQTICSGSATTLVNISSAVTGAIITWSCTPPSGISGAIISGTTTIPVQTLINSTDFPLTVSYNALASVSGGLACPGLSNTYSIIVNPTPAILQPADLVACNGSQTSLISFTGTATSYAWTNDIPSIGLGASGTGNISPFTAVNNGSVPIVSTLTVTPQYTNGGLSCPGSPGTFTITVNPTPTVNQPVSQLICKGAATTLVSFTGLATAYAWDNDNPSIGLGANGTGDIPPFIAINNGNTPITATISVTPLFTTRGTTCPGSPKRFGFTVNPSPSVQFSIPDQTICSGNSTALVNLTSSTSNATLSWSCTPPAGISGATSLSGTTSIPAQTLTNTTALPLTVRYVAVASTTGGSICPGLSYSYDVVVNPTPSVTQPADAIACNGAQTNLISFAGTGTSYTWTNNMPSIGLGASGTGNISAFRAVNTGNLPVVATITVTPQYANGGLTCQGPQRTFTFTINASPAVQFSMPDQTICSGSSTTLVNLSSATTGATIIWSCTPPAGISGAIAGGTASLPVQTLVNSTNFPLTVSYSAVASTSGGLICPGLSNTYHIIVNPTPAIIQPADLVACNGSQTTLINFTGNLTSYVWNNDTPSIGLGASGTGNISPFTAVNAGTTPIEATVTVTPQYANGGVTCPGDPKTFTITANPTSTLIQPANQQLCVGSQTTLIRFSGTGTAYAWTNNDPSIGLGASGTGDILPFTATNNGTADAVATITATPQYANAGLICDGLSRTFSISVSPKPTVHFGMSQNIGCSPLTISFIDDITGPADGLAWDFGDGSPIQPSNSFNHMLLHTFTYAGTTDTTYTITLTGTNNCGTGTIMHSVNVKPNTVNAFFNTDNLAGCVPHTVQFTNHSRGGTTYYWDFGDGNVSNLPSPGHTYAVPGIYTAMLAVTNGCSHDTVRSNPITVYPITATNFSFHDNICAADTLFFVNHTPALANSVWNFGDGSPLSRLTNPYHVYTVPGTYQVTLSAMNMQNRCPSDKVIPVHINFVPRPSFTANQNIGCSPFIVHFNNQTDSLNNNTYIWNFYKGSSSGLTTPPVQTFANLSHCTDTVFNVRLIANNKNCSDTAYASITVHPGPKSDFMTDDSLFCNFSAPANIQFNQQSLCAQSFQWFVSDILVSTIQNPSILFPKASIYDVSLVVENQFQCADRNTKKYTVYPDWKSQVSINPASGCAPLGVSFQSPTGNLAYLWNFGDLTTSSQVNNYHLYQADGIYTIRVNVSGDGGCRDSLILPDNITVHQSAFAGFANQNITIPPPNDGTVLFTNTSRNATLFSWDFGDGTMYYGRDTIHRYLSNNNVEVSLIANNQYNCPDTAYAIIKLAFFRGLFIPNAFSPSNSDIKIQNFFPIGIGLETYHCLVYDTWGNKLWESEALDDQGRPTEYWDGRVSGNLLPMDAYVWKATATFKDGTIWSGMDTGDGILRNYGTITIIK